MGNTKKPGNGGSSEEEEEILDEEEVLDEEELDEEEDEEEIEGEEEDEEDEGDEEDDEDDDENLSEEELRAKLKKQKQIAKNQKIRAEKAESKLKKNAPPSSKKSSTKKQAELSTADVFTLVKAGVHEDDTEEIRDYASLKKMTIKEALKTSFIKTLLAEKEEERKTAEAAHTGSSRRSTGRKSSSQILTDAAEGNLPDDPAALAQARIDKKRADRQRQTGRR